MVTLEQVMTGMNLSGNEDQGATIQIYMDEVMSFLKNAGIPESSITVGLVVRGVSDIWNYGGAKGELSPYFWERATQISY